MAIKPTCDRCGKELDTFGGILLGPPNEKSEVKKYHLCVDCYSEIVEDLREK